MPFGGPVPIALLVAMVTLETTEREDPVPSSSTTSMNRTMRKVSSDASDSGSSVD